MRLPLTDKQSSVRRARPRTRSARICASRDEIVRIHSTSGTTGAPSYIPLTATDLENWVTGSARSYAASGLAAGERLVSTYNAGPFVAGAALAAFDRIGVCHVPVGTGNTERLLTAIELLRPDAVDAPSYAATLVEAAEERGIDLAASSVRRVLVAGEPGGGEPAFRGDAPEGWGARVTEAMGIGDIGPSLWGECEAQDGMHLGARDLVHAELVDPETGEPLPLEDGATGGARADAPPAPRRAVAPVPYPRPRRGAHEPLRVRPHRAARALPGTDRRHAHRPRGQRVPVGRPRCRRQLRPRGQWARRAAARLGRRQAGAAAPGQRRAGARPRTDDALAEAIRERLRSVLVVATRVELVPWGSLERSEYKSMLVRR